VLRATAKPVCDALTFALATHGAPDQILTDNGKVFTARFGQGPGPVLFDRICQNNGIKHLLTAPYSPTTTGKVERFHKTYRAEFLTAHDRRPRNIDEAQAALDAWVVKYNTVRPHQSVGDRPPFERFGLAGLREVPSDVVGEIDEDEELSVVPRPAGVNRWVDQSGLISLGGHHYRVGPVFAGEPVEVIVQRGLVEILHAGVLVATHAERRNENGTLVKPSTLRAPKSRPATSGMVVVRSVDSGGSISFAGASYRVGRSWGGSNVEVAIVAGSVQISAAGKVVRVHQIRHDRSKEHGAFSMPNGKPLKRNSA
jgi:hypothetical protein